MLLHEKEKSLRASSHFQGNKEEASSALNTPSDGYWDCSLLICAHYFCCSVSTWSWMYSFFFWVGKEAAEKLEEKHVLCIQHWFWGTFSIHFYTFFFYPFCLAKPKNKPEVKNPRTTTTYDSLLSCFYFFLDWKLLWKKSCCVLLD